MSLVPRVLPLLGVLALRVVFAQAPPRVDSISPAEGPIAGGTAITLRGANLEGATILLDKTAVPSEVVSTSEVRFTTPPHDNTFVAVRAVTAAGTAYTEFLYVPPKLEDLPPGFITTVAGIGDFSGFYRQATAAELRPQGTLAFDAQGNLYVTESGFDRIIRVRPDGSFEPFAGSGKGLLPDGSVGDGGPAEDADVQFPRGIAIDTDGTVYIGDEEHRVRRVDARGIITTIAGDGTPGFSGDGGPARLARVNQPTKLAGDGRGTIYFIDWGNFRIRRITPDGTITTIAGTGTPGFSGDNGPATQAQFDVSNSDFGALALDPGKFLYLADTANNRIRRIDLQTGTITTIVGPSDENGDPTDGLNNVALGGDGNIYYTISGRIRVMSPSGQLLASYGSRNTAGWSDDGTALANVRLAPNDGLVVDRVGNILFNQFQAVRRLNLQSGRLERVAGIYPSIIGENGPAVATTLNFFDHGSLALLPDGDLLIGDGSHERIRRVDRNGLISTYARGGLPQFAPPEWGGETIGGPSSIDVDAAGNLYLTDTGNVFKLDAQGMLHRLTKQGICGYSGDGRASPDAEVCQPFDVIRDHAGNLLIADTNNNRIRRIDAETGSMSTVAGDGGPPSGWEHYCQGTYCGDGGAASQACLNGPSGLAVDQAGNLFIADRCNGRIRKIDREGTITTVMMNAAPQKIAIDSVGRIYSSHAFDVSRFAGDGTATKVACRELSGFSGDGGPAREAICSGAEDLVIDAEGTIYFIDTTNERVRAVRYGASLAPPDASIEVSLTGAALRAVVRDDAGQPAPGVRVEFSVPADGPSCRFPNGSSTIGVLTDASGVAATSCAPACRASAPFTLVARPTGATATASLILSDHSGPCRRRAARH